MTRTLYVNDKDREVWRTAARRAEQNDTSLSALVAQALRVYLTVTPQPNCERCERIRQMLNTSRE